jgi:hypothetical protein
VRMGGRSARLRSGLKWRLTSFCASTGPPYLEVNTRPLSCHSEPTRSYLL